MDEFSGPRWEADVAEVAASLDGETASMWTTGDTLVRQTHGASHPGGMRDRSNNGSGKWIAAMARDLATRHGKEVSEATLYARYATSLAFPPEARVVGLSWTVHRLIGEAAGDSRARLAEFLDAMAAEGKPPSRRNLEVWLDRKPAGDSAEAVARKVEHDPEAAAAVVRAIAKANPEVIAAAVKGSPQVAAAIAEDVEAVIAVERAEDSSEAAARGRRVTKRADALADEHRDGNGYGRQAGEDVVSRMRLWEGRPWARRERDFVARYIAGANAEQDAAALDPAMFGTPQ